ncbi:P-loop containing nucleoside triphosphate hydrolase protein [Trametes polyzona]|nr:P-loop containing nucleoside triphosphate hydrolase protein [Trametes polyzona]
MAVGPSGAAALPSVEEVREKTFRVFKRRPCLWQCEIARAVLRGNRDIVCISGTGSGKTLTFWMPLLFRSEGIQVIITPLNILGSQNTKQLAEHGIRAIAICAKTASTQNFEKIGKCAFRVVVVNPELAFMPKGGFWKLWKNRAFTSRLLSIVWDEAHCVHHWAEFRKDYADAGHLRNLISAPFVMPSATMPDPVLDSVLNKLNVQRAWLDMYRRSNDRPNVYLMVRRMQHPVSSYKDLDFLIPADWKPGDPLPKFLVFLDNIDESIQAADVLRKRLPPEYKFKVLCFHSDTSAPLREDSTEEFKTGLIWGLYCTDSFGMGVDIRDVKIVVQWRLSCNMDTLVQRIGRAARGPGTEAVAVILVEGKYFDEEKAAAAKRAEKRAEKRLEADKQKAVVAEQRKRHTQDPARSERPTNRPRMDETGVEAGGPSSDVAAVSAPAAPSTYERLRVEYKLFQAAASPTNSGRVSRMKKADTDTLTPELDNLVNAGTRAFRCYLPDNHRCLPGAAGGCTRCQILPSAVCCSLCSPNHPAFSFLPSDSAPVPRTTAPRASHIDTKYVMSSTDIDFRAALHDFRCAEMISIYGRANFNNLGTGMVMGDVTLSRIADCARARKLSSPEDLYKETKWDLSWELGQRVLELINRHYPPLPSPLAATPQRGQGVARPDTSTPTSATDTSRSNAPRRCGACSQSGHTRRSKACPKYGQTAPQGAGGSNTTHTAPTVNTSPHNGPDRSPPASAPRPLPRPLPASDPRPPTSAAAALSPTHPASAVTALLPARPESAAAALSPAHPTSYNDFWTTAFQAPTYR